ncbi:unnamed protein product [Haemonchus placei]|uniref:Peptidase A2 domain-containing protein n=1 Tax=Haemonchus placei TaxID=6290 RepID=A0A0N4WS21_HAEPC|nr:unnamed protein product [Haemonchus placei]
MFVDTGVKIDKDYYLKTILEDALLPLKIDVGQHHIT